MKTNLSVVLIAICLLGFTSTPSRAYTDVSVGVQVNAVGDFYAPLDAYGHWVVIEGYGRCWYPERVHSYWRPYCYGSWVWTDCGWYWASDEPWGWACYHYGRWTWDAGYGWVWVPDVVWGPAWVSFRYSDAYVGWAPLPPRVVFSHGVIVDVAVPPLWFVFVEPRHFCGRVTPSVVVVDEKIVNKTVNITKIKTVNKTVINEGPSVDVVEKRSGAKVRTAKVAELSRESTPPAQVDERWKKKSNSAPTERQQPAGEQPKLKTAPAPSPREERKAIPSEKPADRPSERAIEKPAEKPSERAIERPAEKPSEKAIERPPEKPREQPKEQPEDRPQRKHQKDPYREMPPDSYSPDSSDQSPGPPPRGNDPGRGQGGQGQGQGRGHDK